MADTKTTTTSYKPAVYYSTKPGWTPTKDKNAVVIYTSKSGRTTGETSMGYQESLKGIPTAKDISTKTQGVQNVGSLLAKSVEVTKTTTTKTTPSGYIGRDSLGLPISVQDASYRQGGSIFNPATGSLLPSKEAGQQQNTLTKTLEKRNLGDLSIKEVYLGQGRRFDIYSAINYPLVKLSKVAEAGLTPYNPLRVNPIFSPTAQVSSFLSSKNFYDIMPKINFGEAVVLGSLGTTYQTTLGQVPLSSPAKPLLTTESSLRNIKVGLPEIYFESIKPFGFGYYKELNKNTYGATSRYIAKSGEIKVIAETNQIIKTTTSPNIKTIYGEGYKIEQLLGKRVGGANLGFTSIKTTTGKEIYSEPFISAFKRAGYLTTPGGLKENIFKVATTSGDKTYGGISGTIKLPKPSFYFSEYTSEIPKYYPQYGKYMFTKSAQTQTLYKFIGKTSTEKGFTIMGGGGKNLGSFLSKDIINKIPLTTTSPKLIGDVATKALTPSSSRIVYGAGLIGANLLSKISLATKTPEKLKLGQPQKTPEELVYKTSSTTTSKLNFQTQLITKLNLNQKLSLTPKLDLTTKLTPITTTIPTFTIPEFNIPKTSPPIIPVIFPSGSVESFGRLRTFKGKQRKKYTPSFESVIFNIRGKMPKGSLTGLTPRPIPKRFKWRF